MPSDPNIYAIGGDFGPVGSDVINRLTSGRRRYSTLFGADVETTSAILSFGASASLYEIHVVADPHLVGEFSLIGAELLNNAFPGNRGVFVSRARTKYAILKGTGSGEITVTPSNLLTLDWVKDAQPFVWVAADPPSLLTLDWVQDGQPFVSNDVNTEVTSSAAFYIRAGTSISSVNGNVVPGGADLWIFAEVGVAEDGITPVDPPAITSCTLSIIAGIRCTATNISTFSSTLTIQAIVTVDEVVAYATVSEFSLAITASAGLADTDVQAIRPCQIPGQILNLSSNLPFGIWQTDPDAIFTWNMVFTCSLGNPGARVPVTGFLVVLDHQPSTAPWWDATRTPVAHDEFLLDTLPAYGAGSWWFHVSAYNSVGIGLPAHYNVRYNHPPGDVGLYMKINGLDTIKHRPLVAFAPVTPHVLTWGDASDVDPSDMIVYQLQIAITLNFQVNISTGSSEIVLEADSVPANLYVLTQSLSPLVYYWRIRAFDGQQYGNWSVVGSFRVNHPPNAPSAVQIYATG